MNEEPHKLLLRTSDVLRWTGISRTEFEKLLRSGLVHGIALRPNGHRFYHREHIRAMIINKVKGN